MFRTLLLVAALMVPATAQARVCFVSDLDGGTARIERGETRIALPSDTPILQGDRLIKTPRTRLTIRCDDGTEIRIAAGSAIDLGPLIASDPSTPLVIRLLRGIAGFVMPNTAGTTVLTPNAVASVRSTEWTVSFREGATDVFVREGRVDVSDRAGRQRVILRAGDGVTVSADGVVGEVRQWGAPRIDAMNARLGSGWD